MNIYPAEVDAVLLEHPAVADVATIGVPDDEWGESVHGGRRAAAPASSRATRWPTSSSRSAATALAHFKCPRAVDFVEHLPARGQRQDLQAPAARRVPGPRRRRRDVPVPPFAHLNLTVTDVERSEAFYARWFGFDQRPETYSDDTRFVRNGDGFDLAFHPGTPPSPPAPTVHFGFRTAEADDVRALLAELARRRAVDRDP